MFTLLPIQKNQFIICQSNDPKMKYNLHFQAQIVLKIVCTHFNIQIIRIKSYQDLNLI